MVAVMSMMVFAGALAISIAVIVAAVGPQWQRILRVAAGRTESVFMPLEQLVRAERHIAVRRWASAPVPAAVRRLREVA